MLPLQPQQPKCHASVKEGRSSPLYGDGLVLHPDGTEMFRCTRKRADWYLSRSLAKVISDDEHIIIQLLFEPKGKGHAGDDFFLGKRENLCVCCGINENITRHHIVPYFYRRALPKEVKCSNHHDVVAMCIDCHHRYERAADKVKFQLSKQYNAPLSVYGSFDKSSMIGKDVATLHLHKIGRIKLPPEIVQAKEKIVSTYLGRTATESDLQELRSNWRFDMVKRHGEIVVSQITDIQGFVEMWRNHFLQTMAPKFMPSGWDVKRSCIGSWRKSS
jgi:hypothetical protein